MYYKLESFLDVFQKSIPYYFVAMLHIFPITFLYIFEMNCCIFSVRIKKKFDVNYSTLSERNSGIKVTTE